MYDYVILMMVGSLTVMIVMMTPVMVMIVMNDDHSGDGDLC